MQQPRSRLGSGGGGGAINNNTISRGGGAPPHQHHQPSTATSNASSRVLFNHNRTSQTALPVRSRWFPTNHPILWSAFYIIMTLSVLYHLKSSQDMLQSTTSTRASSSSYLSSINSIISLFADPYSNYTELEAPSASSSNPAPPPPHSIAIIMVDNRDLFSRAKDKPQRIWYGQMTADINRDYACKVGR